MYILRWIKGFCTGFFYLTLLVFPILHFLSHYLPLYVALMVLVLLLSIKIASNEVYSAKSKQYQKEREKEWNDWEFISVDPEDAERIKQEVAEGTFNREEFEAEQKRKRMLANFKKYLDEQKEKEENCEQDSPSEKQ